MHMHTVKLENVKYISVYELIYKYTIYKTNKRIRSECHIEHNLANRPPALQKFETFLHRLAVERQHLSQDRFDQTFICQAGKDIFIMENICLCTYLDKY